MTSPHREQDNPFALELAVQRAALDAKRRIDDEAWAAALAEAVPTWDLYREAVRRAGCREPFAEPVEIRLRREDHHHEERGLADARIEVLDVVLVCDKKIRRRHALVWTPDRGWKTRRGSEPGHGTLEDALFMEMRGLAADIEEVQR